MAIETINPATGKKIKTFSAMKDSEVEHLLNLALKVFGSWKKESFRQRAALLKKVGEDLRKNKQKYGELITLEMGKPITQSIAEVEKCAWVCDYYAEHAEKHLSEDHISTENKHSYVRFDPLGIVLAVMPWNYPFWQVFRAAAPALMAGNVIVLKHSSNVPQCSLLLQKIFEENGAEKGLFTTILVEGREMNTIVADERIATVTVTGSEEAGRRVAEVAGAHLKKTVLELGGSDPFIILDDADLDKASNIASAARTINAGQSCIAAKRFIVVKSVAKKFTQLFVEKMEALRVGDPMDPKTQVGPMARKDLMEGLNEQVTKSMQMGAKLLTGGTKEGEKGYYYCPTVLSDVEKGMPAYHEELFGPVASIIVVKDEHEAIKIANDTIFGLGSSIWTQDIEKGKLLAEHIEAGAVFINDMVKSDPRLPFGGIKRSGYGRELGMYGIREFVNIKTVVVK